MAKEVREAPLRADLARKEGRGGAVVQRNRQRREKIRGDIRAATPFVPTAGRTARTQR